MLVKLKQEFTKILKQVASISLHRVIAVNQPNGLPVKFQELKLYKFLGKFKSPEQPLGNLTSSMLNGLWVSKQNLFPV